MTEIVRWPTLLRACLFCILTGPALAQPAALNNKQVATKIVQDSRQAYYATGHPCARPEDLARNRSRCGGRNAYSRPRGASPKCYVSDVSAAEIEAYRRRAR